MPRAAWLALGATAGALGIGAIGPTRTVAAGALVVAVALAVRVLGTGRSDLSRRTTQALALAIGALAIGARAIAGAGAPVAPVPIPSGNGPWVGTIQSIGPERAGTRPAVILITGPPALVVAATLPGYPPVVPADRVELAGRIQPPPHDDYGDYLGKIGAIGTLRADSLNLLPPSQSIAAFLEDLRRGAAAGLDRTMPEPEAGLAAGVLIGLRDRVDRDLAKDFTTAGASHVVAISGWNIAIVASTLAAVAGGIGRRRRAILTAAAIVLYIAFVGPSSSVVRAGVMAGVALLARELGRPGTAAAALGWAVAGLLILDPATVDDAGFRLSVLATAGILAWGTSMTERLSGPDPGRLRKFLAETLGVSLAAQAATTPIVLLDFGRLSLIAPLVNLVVVPLVPGAMAAGAVALGAGVLVNLGLPEVLGAILGLPGWAFYTAMVAAVRAGASAPFASVQLDAPWDTISAAISAVAIFAGARWGPRALAALRPPATNAPAPVRPRRKANAATTGAAKPGGAKTAARPRTLKVIAAGVAWATLGLAIVVAHRPDGAARVTVLDVGQGDAILVESGRGSRMLVDGGAEPGRLLAVLGERLAPWDRRIDAVVLTHPHEDHVAGLARLMERYRVGRVYEPGMLGPGPGYRAWEELLAGGGPPRGRLSTGDRLTLDEIHFRVLWPDANAVPREPPDGGTGINNVSIVLLGEVAGHRFLLAGDIEEDIDPILLPRGLPTVDLLKVAHHGSKTASTEPFLESVRPKVAVASAGTGNPYGHPAPSTIERLQAITKQTYRTDRDGSVEIVFDGPSIRVHASGGRPVPTPKPKATEAPTASLAGVAAATTAINPATATPAFAFAFACAVPLRAGVPATRVAWADPARHESATEPRAVLGPGAAARVATTEPLLYPRLAEVITGGELALRYHRPDGDVPRPGDRNEPRHGAPGVSLGRRRVRSRCRPRCLPERLDALSRRRAGALAAGRARRSRPPPR
jgi:competence protein ComEC